MEKVIFEVKKIVHRNEDNGFTVCRAKFDTEESPHLPATQQTIVGTFISIFEHDMFEAEGHFLKHQKFGKQFQIKWAKRIVPKSKKSLEMFLTNHIKGVGKKTAERIVETLGTNAVHVILENWRELLAVPNMTEKKAKKIAETLIEGQMFQEVFAFLSHYGIGYEKSIAIYEKMKMSTIPNIKENPYCLASIKGITFEEMDHIAKKLDFPCDHRERIKQGILTYLEHKAKQEGHLFMTSIHIQEQFPSFLLDIGAYKETVQIENLDDWLYDLEREEKIVIETNNNHERCVYLSHYAHIENKIVQYIKRRTKSQSLFKEADISACLNMYEKEYGIQLASQQKEAVYMALSEPISILTGGPGTGKTQTINAIIFCIENIKPNAEIHLCAPTGKASKRLSEVTKREAKTIHRTIGLRGFENTKEVRAIEGDFLVVDEVSMVDAYVFYKLLSATKPEMNILLVGDYEQLPSVGAGLILRDLIESKAIPTTKLSDIFRQAQDSQIVMNAHKIIKGKTTKDPDGITFDHTKGDFFFIEERRDFAIKEYMIKSIQKMKDAYGYTLDDIQVLSPTKFGELGTHVLNQAIQQAFNPNKNEEDVIVLKNKTFRIGDKVIQTVNNYDLEVFNGEVGRIDRIEKTKNTSIIVVFDDREVRYSLAEAEELELAYAISIHKSQGSEYPVIIMPIHKSHAFMLNRNLIYTAWTRAKNKVVCIGEQRLIDIAIEKRDKTIRHSLIKEKLSEKTKTVISI